MHCVRLVRTPDTRRLWGTAMTAYTRFFTTAAGARIAYATLGQGPPLILIPALTSHIEVLWEDPSFRAFYEALAAHFTLIRYDRYGCGLSDRNRTDFRWQVDVQILGEIIEHLGLRRVALYGPSAGGTIAIRFALAQPERVSHLLLWGVSWQDEPNAVQAAVNQMIRAEWRIGANTFADLLLPAAHPDARKAFARVIREAATPEMMVGLRESGSARGLAALLPDLRVPTLVLARRDDQVSPLESACELVRHIPNACLATLDGDCYVAEFGDIDAVVRAMRGFIGTSGATRTDTNGHHPHPNGATTGQLGLSPREVEVLRLVAEGLTDAQVAARLSLSPRTVGQHLRSIYNKCDLPSRSAATRFAFQHNLA